MDADDHHRGVDAEVLAANTSIGNMTVGNSSISPGPRRVIRLIPAPHTTWKFQIRSTFGTSRDVQAIPPARVWSGVHEPVPQEVVPAAEADNSPENGSIGAIVQVHRPFAVQFEPIRDEPAHLRVEAEVLDVADRPFRSQASRATTSAPASGRRPVR